MRMGKYSKGYARTTGSFIMTQSVKNRVLKKRAHTFLEELKIKFS